MDWNPDDRAEDGKDTLISENILTPARKGYDPDYAFTSKPSSSRIPLQSPFKGKIVAKTNGSINGNPFYKGLNKKIIHTSSSTAELSDGKMIKKSDIATPKSNSSTTRSFKGNIFFPYFPNHNVEVGQKRENLLRQNKPQKQQPRTRKQTKMGYSDNNTRTRVSRASSKSSRRQPPRSKKSTILPGYLASEECIFIPSDISDISDWEWIARGFPRRNVARERNISASINNLKHDDNLFNSRETNNNIGTEILENNDSPIDKLSMQCPISSIPAKRNTTTQCPISITPSESSTTTSNKR